MAENVPQVMSTKRERVAWYLYDFGNSAYASVVLLAVYSAYFKNQVVGGAEGSRLWGLTISVAMILVAIAAPIMGAIADYSGAKKKFLFFFTAISVVFTAMLFFTEKGTVALAIIFFLLSEVGYRAAQIFYDALLPEIASPEETGRIAGTGWAVGSAGGIVILLIILPPILMTKSDLFVVRLTLIVTAMFFAL
ncbi:MAG: MFS transporter, partial [Chloroflexi bacterium]